LRPVTILGAGMAGCGAAHRLHAEGAASVMYEKSPYFGGHTASYVYDQQFVFDDGPHVSFTKVERIQQLLADNVNGEYQTIQARVNNHWQGLWIKHPAQCNLHGLPVSLVTDILADMIGARMAPPREVVTYADWLHHSFGRTFTETFPRQYGRKYHTTDAANMTTDWLGPRLYVPEMREVIAGALSPSTPEVHYVSHFRYPTHGGFVAYLRPFIRQTRLHLDHRVAAVDPVARTLAFANGVETGYDDLISSVPLPELIPMIKGVPARVLEASRRLACTSCVMVNIVVDRPDISDAHWSYFYDDDYFFTRLAFPHMQSPFNTPPGTGSIQAEVYYSPKYRPLDRHPDECIAPVVADLRRCGLIKENDRIVFANATLAKYANVIFDLDRPEALATVHAYLDEIGILYCGRYGEWGYQWTDQAFMSGEDAAQRSLDRRRRTAAAATQPHVAAPAGAEL
jgi:protoporphyrinogen oxidase